MEIFIIIITILLLILGIIGSFLPVLPGPPLSFMAMLIFRIWGNNSLTNKEVWIFGIIAIIITILDYIAPAIMTKSFGGSKLASNMAIAGMIVGIFFFPPVGMIIGPFLGAFIGELIEKRKTVHALKIALLSFIAFILSTGLKFIYSIVTFYYVVISLF